MNGAVLSLLEALFVPNFQIRILGGCLTADTKVSAVEEQKRVSEVKEGEEIWTAQRKAKVLAVFKRKYKGDVIFFRGVGAHCCLTPDHLILTDEGWMPAGDYYENFKSKRNIPLLNPARVGEVQLHWSDAFILGFAWGRMKLRTSQYRRWRSYVVSSCSINSWTEKRRVLFLEAVETAFRRHGVWRSIVHRHEGGKQLFGFGKGLLKAVCANTGIWEAEVPLFLSRDCSFAFQFDRETIRNFLLGAIVARAEMRREGQTKRWWIRAKHWQVQMFRQLGAAVGWIMGDVKSFFSSHTIRMPLEALLLLTSERPSLFSQRGFVTKDGLAFFPRRVNVFPYEGDVYDLSIEGAESFNIALLHAHNSLSQSEKMYLHILRFAQRPFIAEDIERLTTRAAIFKNGSCIEILPHSVKQVRSAHVDVIRCDEVDEFNRKVWNALQFSTKRVEKLSTRQYADGIMAEEVEKAQRLGDPIFKWTVFEVGVRCQQRCRDCVLQRFCQKRLRNGAGYKPISEIRREYLRSPLAFEREMLCKEPRMEGVIFGAFENAYPFVVGRTVLRSAPVWRAIDFGHRDPCVCLWIQKDEGRKVFQVVDMIYKRGLAPSEFARLILKKEAELGYQNIIATWGDPSAAMARAELAKYGVYVLHKRVPKEKRINAIKELLVVRDDGLPSLQICRNCKKLIDELLAYDIERFTKGTKDDCVEALGYWAVNVSSLDSVRGKMVVTSAFRDRGSLQFQATLDFKRRLFPNINPRPFSGGEL